MQQAESAAELNQASAMKARAEAGRRLIMLGLRLRRALLQLVLSLTLMKGVAMK